MFSSKHVESQCVFCFGFGCSGSLYAIPIWYDCNCTPAFIVQDALDHECPLQCFPTPGTSRATYLSRWQAQSWMLDGRATTSSWGPMKPRDRHFPLNSWCLSLIIEWWLRGKHGVEIVETYLSPTTQNIRNKTVWVIIRKNLSCPVAFFFSKRSRVFFNKTFFERHTFLYCPTYSTILSSPSTSANSTIVLVKL